MKSGEAMVFKKLKIYGDLVMFQHTLFAMPFALSAFFISAGGFPGWYKFIWVLLAMIGARNGANALNRVVDSEIDKKNSRTAGRHMPAGIVKRKEVLILAFVCFGLFAVSAFMLNPLCAALLPIPAALFILYSYTKRFTWLCHLILGAAIGGAPLGAWLAVTGKLDYGIFPALILGAAAALWVAGFDIIYATQDLEFDKSQGLHSIPVKFGIKRALAISSVFHALASVLLFSMPLFAGLGVCYLVGAFIISCLLYYEHSIVSPEHLDSVKIASYSINEIVGVVFLVFTCLDILLF